MSFLDLHTRVGFLTPEGTASHTWIQLNNSHGEIELSAGGTATSDDDILLLEEKHDLDQQIWIHMAVTCNRLSARCYLFRNGSFIGESAEDITKDWFVSTDLYIGRFMCHANI